MNVTEKEYVSKEVNGNKEYRVSKTEKMYCVDLYVNDSFSHQIAEYVTVEEAEKLAKKLKGLL